MKRPPRSEPPVLIAIAGPNGAGKSTFYQTFLKDLGLPWLNADVLAHELHLGAYQAAEIVKGLRDELYRKQVSFVFETVFSDPVGDKVQFLKEAAASGYDVTLCFIGLSKPGKSIERVDMRVSQGGHDVPADKLRERFPRILANLQRAIHELPHVIIYDNDRLSEPFRKLAEVCQGRLTESAKRLPGWLRSVLDSLPDGQSG